MQQDETAVQGTGELCAVRGVPVHSIQQDGVGVNVDSIIRKYLGVKYVHGGRDKNVGLDCYGLVIALYQDYGITIDDWSGYEQNFAAKGKNYIAENYHKQWCQVATPHTLDVVLFHNYEGVVNHIGVYMTRNRVLHCTRAGVVMSVLDNKIIFDKIAGFYRYKGDA